jgi:hypothetical protein
MILLTSYGGIPRNIITVRSFGWFLTKLSATSSYSSFRTFASQEGTPFSELTTTQRPLRYWGTRLAESKYNIFLTITAIVALYRVLTEVWDRRYKEDSRRVGLRRHTQIPAPEREDGRPRLVLACWFLYTFPGRTVHANG